MKHLSYTLGAVAISASLLACSGGEAGPGSGTSESGAVPLGGMVIPPDAQRPGDPAKGYEALVNEGYVSCGIPYTAYKAVFDPAPPELQLPGRNALNAPLPFDETRFTTTSGVDVVSANCLTCHAGFIKGKLVVGLGDTQSDFTQNNEGYQLDLAQGLLNDPNEKAELTKFTSRIKAITPYIGTSVVGVNPADNIAAVLFAHRDPKTLAWSDTPLIALPSQAAAVPVDVPPWWRMAKKNSMFYVAGGRGDHARIEMTASTLCTDSVEEAKKIDAYFPDVAAFIASIVPPAFEGPVDAALADQGKTVFESTCSRCHGTYGPTGEYPNLILSLAEVGTDPLLAEAPTQFSAAFVKWFNDSFYGEIASFESHQGYVAPPLDGIWATAPYLHNGSIPTLEALLDSSKRPKYWTRKLDADGGYDSNDYDDAALGWRFTALDHGQAEEPHIAVRRRIYDTTLLGYSNTGHTFGDSLSTDERKALIEYLKTL